MPKSILVINEPDFCCNCMLYQCIPDEDGYEDYYCGVRHKKQNIEFWLPDWCPLRELNEETIKELGEKICMG